MTTADKKDINSVTEKLAAYFSNSDVTCNLLSSSGTIIGKVTTTIDSKFLVFIF